MSENIEQNTVEIEIMDKESNPTYARVMAEEGQTFFYDDFLFLIDDNFILLNGVNTSNNKTDIAPWDLKDTNFKNRWNGSDWYIADITPNDVYEYKQILIDIDKVADTVILNTIGARQAEYQLARSQAETWISQGMKGDIPSMIAVSVQATGCDPETEAKSIIELGKVWEQAMALIRYTRLKAKHEVRVFGENLNYLKLQQSHNTFSYYKAEMDLLNNKLNS